MKKYLGQYDTIELVAGVLMLATALLSAISTLSTLWLIYDMKKWNGYLQIIFTLALCQFIFDIQFSLVPFFENEVCNRITSFLNIFGGFSVMLWTNVISFLLYRIVKSLKTVNINDYFWGFFAVITFISLFYAILENIYHYNYDDNTADVIFNCFRVMSVFFNFTIHGLISMKLNDMGYGRHDGRIEKVSKDPVRVLSSRIKYYPIVQVITLSGAFWYLFRYGYDTDNYNKWPMSTAQQVSLVLYAVSLPAAGFGYFVIFLLFQPQAYLHYKKRMSGFCRSCCCCAGKPTNRDDVIFDNSEPTSVNSSIFTQPVAENRELLLEADELDEDQLVQAIMKRYAPEDVSEPHGTSTSNWHINSL